MKSVTVIFKSKVAFNRYYPAWQQKRMEKDKDVEVIVVD